MYSFLKWVIHTCNFIIQLYIKPFTSVGPLIFLRTRVITKNKTITTDSAGMLVPYQDSETIW